MKPTLNILMVCKTLPWKFKGGIQTHTWLLSKSLVALGHQVTILTAGSVKEGIKEFEKDGINLVELPYFPGRYIKPVALLAEELGFNLAARQWVKKNHQAFDIIHAQGRSGYLLHTIKSIRYKLVNTVHGLVKKEISNAKGFNLNTRLHSIVSQHFESGLLRHCSNALSVSQDLKQNLQTALPEVQLNVVPNGVSIEHEETPDHAQASGRFLFVGRLHPVKGIFPLVNAMKNASKGMVLDIIGNGPQYQAIAQFIAEENLSDKVRLLGEQEHDKVMTLLPYYQALVLPSYYETQGIVLLEANARAVPVIASDIPAIRETVTDGENGLLCDPHHPEQFVSAMEEIMNNPEKARKMGALGRSKVLEHYSWKKIARETVNIYRKVAC